MTKIWTAPRQWDIGELNDDLKMMEISNSLEWLKDRPQDNKWVTNTGANATQAVTGAGNWFAVNDAFFTLTFTTAVANERVRIDWDGIWSTGAVLGNALYYDVLLDDTNYISSGTPTSSGVGLKQLPSVAAANVLQPFMTFHLAIIPTAGLHTLKLRWGGTAGQTLTLYISNTNQFSRFSVLDI